MWTYRKFVPDVGFEADAKELPPPGSVYQAFDALRWARVVGYTERGGYSSFLDPNVNDDCQIIAFAPLDEQTAPDENELCKAWTLGGVYAPGGQPVLLLSSAS